MSAATGLGIVGIVFLLLFIWVTTWKHNELPENVSADAIAVIESETTEHTHKCGHTGPTTYVVSIYGERTKPISDGERCPACFIEWVRPLVIRCALCRLPIYPGNGVALYDTKLNSNAHFHLDIATRINGDGVLGCLRMNCCPSGAFFAGNWDGEKFVPRYGGRTAAAEAFQTGKMVVSNTD